MLFMAPTVINITHVFSGHSHEICEHYADEHVHTKNLDCELYQFQKNSALSINVQEYTPEISLFNKVQLPDFYENLSNYIKLPFELRGPPLA